MALVKGKVALMRATEYPAEQSHHSFLIGGDGLTVQASSEDQLPEHRGKHNLQHIPAAKDDAPPSLETMSLKIRSLERGLPGSISSPSILADTPDHGETHVKEAPAQASATAKGDIQRCQSWSQEPSIVSRLTSWKGAGQDYTAMQVLYTGTPPLTIGLGQAW